ncbi:MAG: hypothetical protein JXR76_30680 [Deltaproteobacteria bacterium]|nr:hypothetical protein [Deltaproteobacteria bacterium]
MKWGSLAPAMGMPGAKYRQLFTGYAPLLGKTGQPSLGNVQPFAQTGAVVTVR